MIASKDYRLLFFLMWFPLGSFAQSASSYLIGLQGDFVKTDNTRLLDKAQFGAELNYFVTDHFTGTTGFEIWTDDEISFVIGGRWYPSQDGFLRIRGLVGENEISVGGGWVKPITNNLKFEAIADFYFSIDFSIRGGLVFVID
jgi:hypothetical protein